MNDANKTLQDLIDKNKILKYDNKFQVCNRIEEWKSNAALYGDDYLLRLRTAMLKVFCEESPEFNIDKAQRLLADPETKKTHYSNDIRLGLAIELAFVGNFHDLLVNCSSAIKDNFVTDIIHETFSGMTWKRLATLDDVLPFFAEASPDSFLKEMVVLAKDKHLFAQLVDDEGNIFQGGFHWIGIVDALKTLAWEQDCLIRVVDLLASLALLDRESNIHPRPKDALSSFFWPWHPQTCATTQKVIAAAKVLINRHNKLGWDVLTRSVDARVGTFNRMPKVRKSLPDGFDNSLPKDSKRGWALVKGYEELMLESASVNTDLLYPLAQHLGHLKYTDSFDIALKTLSSQVVLDGNDEFKEKIWTELRKLCLKHRLHRETEWAMQADRLNEIDKVIELLTPKSLLFQKKYLFDNGIWDWHESNDYLIQDKKIQEQQIDAAKNIFALYGFDGIFDLLKYISNPSSLGETLCFAGIDLSQDQIVRLLGDQCLKSQGLLGGYLCRCFYEKGDAWLSSFRKVSLGVEQKATFLCLLPFVSSVWHFCEEWLGDYENLYWQACKTHAIPNEPDSQFAINKALNYDRPDIAIECLFWNSHDTKTIDFDTCVKALLSLVNHSRVKDVDSWRISQLILELQKHKRNDEQNHALVQIEFLYLPLLDSNVHDDISPITLDSALATDPEFFHQVLTFVYKSDNPDMDVQVEEWASRNAWRLLFQWKKMPGVDNGTLDYNAFVKWYDEVIKLCKASGRLNCGQTHIGHILIYTPPDPSGLWIDKRIAALLDLQENDALRDGYYTATYNSRGIHEVDMSGKEDLEIAETFKKKAGDLEDEGFLTFAQTLRDIAQAYVGEATRWQKESERLKHQGEL